VKEYKMRIKLCVVALLAVIVVASAGMGISYAINGLSIGGVPSCYCDVAFTSAELGDPADNEIDKDVASATVTLNAGGSSITVDITVAYPGYEAYIDFTITNLGNKPIDVDGVVSEIYDVDALEIVITGVVAGTVLDVGASLDGTVTIKVLPGAEQNTQYPFTMGLGFSNTECLQYTHVETVTVDANDPNPTTSIAILEYGVGYTLVATGTADALNSPDRHIYFDAKYSLTTYIPGDTWTDSVSGYTGYGPTLLDLFVNGASGDWGVYNEDHTYECTITGDDNPVELWIYDIYYPNNVGSLTVEIYEIL
jgi:hypothetical protein